jgi:hypothetical protein
MIVKAFCVQNDRAATQNKFVKFKVLMVVKIHIVAIQINQPTRCNSFSSLLLDVYVQLNMFCASSRPPSGAVQPQWQPLVLPLEHGGSNAVGRGQVGRREDARNMLSCT